MKLLKRIALLILLSLSVNAFAATEFISAINKTGEDYSTCNLWEAAMDNAGDITAADVLVFSHGGKTGTINDGASVTGASSGATGTVIHATATQILIDAIASGPFSSGEQVRVDVSNYVTISDAGDSPIIVAEFYSDDGILTTNDCIIDGLTTDADNYWILRAATEDRHSGVYGGATLQVTVWGNGKSLISAQDPYVIVEYLSLLHNKEYIGTMLNAAAAGVVFRNNILTTDATDPNDLGNAVVVSTSGAGTYILNNIAYNNNVGFIGYTSSGNTFYFYNNTAYGNTHNFRMENNYGPVVMRNNISVSGDDYSTWGSPNTTGSSNNITEDDDMPGDTATTQNLTTEFFESATDFHLRAGSDAVDAGADLGTTYNVQYDIDGVARSGTWDVGADEYVAATSRRIWVSKGEAQCWPADWIVPQEAGKCKVGNRWYSEGELF